MAVSQNNIGLWYMTGLGEVKVSHCSSKNRENCCSLNRNGLIYQLKELGTKKMKWYEMKIFPNLAKETILQKVGEIIKKAI